MAASSVACYFSIVAGLLTLVTCVYTPTSVFPEPAARSLYEFGFDVFDRTAQSSGDDANVIVSPISMFAVLSILTPGLAGNSYKEVVNALRLSEFENPAEAEAEMCAQVFANNSHFSLRRANRIFADSHVVILKTFKESSKRFHKAPIKRLDFSTKPRQSRSKMNRFVAKETSNEIPELIPEEAVTPFTKIFLVNAVSLKAAWTIPFAKRLTQPGRFQVSPSDHVTVSMMRSDPSRGSKCRADELDGLDAKAVLMPFKGLQLSMVVIMPRVAGDFSRLTGRGARDEIRGYLRTLYATKPLARLWECDISMPKFTSRHNIADLEGTFQAMGIRDIFSPEQANLSNMTTFPNAFVSNAGHEAVLHLDEYGVKAVAASYLSASARVPAMEITLNKPFLYFIRHEPTGATLFIGKVIRPDQ